jgi:undecaprenyl-diphosphatase
MSIDESVFHALNQASSVPGLDLFMVIVSAIGLSFIIVILGPILWWRKQRELAFDIVVLIVVSDLVVELLKLLMMRERPFEVLSGAHTLSWGWLTSATSPAMPSGHAARAFAAATLIALGTRLRWGALALTMAALIGLSRIFLGLHWPSDVLAGALLGITLAAVMNWVGDGDNVYTRARAKAITWLRGQKHIEA